MKIAFLMDPLEQVNARKDTSYYLMLAAKQRGHEVFYFNQASMQANNRSVSAQTSRVDVHAAVDRPFTVVERQRADLAALDVIFVRTDPPFDRAYSYATLLLDMIAPQVLIVNRPEGIRNWNEKLAALHYPELCPQTLVSRQSHEIVEFMGRHARIVLKPIDGHGGEGIEFTDVTDRQCRHKIEAATRDGSRWVIVQEYLEDARAGDRRILLVEGEPIGAVLRVHADGQELNNLDQGARAAAAELTAADLAICRALRQGLLEQGVFFCGIDIIGGKLIEINVTSPTCLQELSQFSGIAYHHQIIARLEARAQGGL